MVVHFVSLAVCASLDIVFDILCHAGPPISFCCEFQGSGNSWVAIGWWVVVHLHYGTSRRRVSGYYKLIVFPPRPTYLFELVGVYPRFQYFFAFLQLLQGKCSYEQLVREYSDVSVVRHSLIVVWSSRESVCTTIVFPQYML